jgi:hypothetical protein
VRIGRDWTGSSMLFGGLGIENRSDTIDREPMEKIQSWPVDRIAMEMQHLHSSRIR